MVEVLLLGTGATRPLPHRALAAMWLQVGGRGMLFDCGEGTQVSAQRYGASLYKLDTLLLTHYHGDHLFGLPGLLQSMAALGRTEPVTVAGPPGLDGVLDAVLALAGPLPFALCRHTFPDCRGTLALPGGAAVTAFPADHRVPCCLYAYTLPRAGRFDPGKARALGIPVRLWRTLQEGQPAGGFTPSQVLGPARRGLRILYATDTGPTPELTELARGADLLCMDATYADETDTPKARLYGHATCGEAGALAAEAGVRRLWLTHYSAAVTDPEPGLAAARALYPGAEAGFDGKRLTLTFDDSEPPRKDTP